MDEPDESLEIGQRSFRRAVEAVEKIGFTEGVEAGIDATMQEDFDKGYEDGFKIAFALGHYKGLAAFLFKDVDHPKEIRDILEITRRGACYICAVESKTEIDDEEKILMDHREHTLSVCKKLKAYFDPLLKSKGIDNDVMKDLNLE